jgi:hypothetical protein
MFGTERVNDIVLFRSCLMYGILCIVIAMFYDDLLGHLICIS